MSDETQKDSKKIYTLLLIISVSVVSVGLMYAWASGVFGLPQAQDIYNKYDHFRFQPVYNFLDSANSIDLEQKPRSYLIIDYYRKTDVNFQKALKETYKDKNGQMIEVVDVNNSEDPIIYMAIQDSEFVKLNPISLTEWNQVLEYESFDIDGDKDEEHIFKLDITKARDYYQLKDKEREFAQVVIMVPVKFNSGIGI